MASFNTAAPTTSKLFNLEFISALNSEISCMHFFNLNISN